jgi:hypothetical protein
MRSTTKLVREGNLVAEVNVHLLHDGGSWSPVLSMGDATRLDEVHEALRTGNLRRAAQLAEHVYRLTPVASRDGR